jgi:hypothetical protein
MTSNPIAASANKMAFVPRDLVTIQVGCTYASVYPNVEPTMPIHERAHAFQVIKSALEALPIDTCLILEAIGAQLNCNAQVDGSMFDFRSMFDKAWYDFANLVIQSFHNSAGTVIQIPRLLATQLSSQRWPTAHCLPVVSRMFAACAFPAPSTSPG